MKCFYLNQEILIKTENKKIYERNSEVFLKYECTRFYLVGLEPKNFYSKYRSSIISQIILKTC